MALEMHLSTKPYSSNHPLPFHVWLVFFVGAALCLYDSLHKALHIYSHNCFFVFLPLVAKICPLKNSISDSHTLLSVLVRAFSSCVRMLHGAFSHKDVASFRPKALQKWLAIPSAEIEVPLKTLLATEEVAMFPLKNWGTCHCRSGWPLKKWPLSH